MNSSGDTEVLDLTPEEDERDRGAIIGWIYLGVIMAVFTAMALWAFGASDGDGTATVVLGAPPATTATAEGPSDPAVIDVSVDRKIATLTGAVPDQGARDQMVRIAEERFGNGNVIDNLTINGGVDLASGTINVTGTADEGDDAPSQLQQTASADLGLAAGAFDVEFVAPQFEPAVVDLAVGETPVIITGRVPSESDRDRLLQSAEAVYGEGNVDISAVTVEPSDIEGALVTISGVTTPGDTRSTDLVGILQTDFRSALVTDESQIDVSDQALEVFEDQLQNVLLEKPILFDTGTSVLSEEGQANLLVIAEAISALPDREVQIIGHTDDTGGDTVNQLLSENRASSVKEALVALGLDGTRLQTSGAGSSDPLVNNNSATNRAKNRRIQFTFERG